jgi:hypothetical protein
MTSVQGARTSVTHVEASGRAASANTTATGRSIALEISAAMIYVVIAHLAEQRRSPRTILRRIALRVRHRALEITHHSGTASSRAPRIVDRLKSTSGD